MKKIQKTLTENAVIKLKKEMNTTETLHYF